MPSEEATADTCGGSLQLGRRLPATDPHQHVFLRTSSQRRRPRPSSRRIPEAPPTFPAKHRPVTSSNLASSMRWTCAVAPTNSMLISILFLALAISAAYAVSRQYSLLAVVFPVSLITSSQLNVATLGQLYGSNSF